MIQSYGWSDELRPAFEGHAAQGRVPARVIVQQRGSCIVRCNGGERRARLSGRFIHEAREADHPVVGDWVALRDDCEQAVIEAVLPRRSAFTRKAAGRQQRPQVVAANIDLALIVLAATADFNLRRLERYLTIARQSGARPAILLTKADIAENLPAQIDAAQSLADDCPIIPLSAVTGEGLDEIIRLLKTGETSVLLGSSGAGKSTLLNCLAGQQLMSTRSVSEHDGKGRHTTTHRELILLPGGALIIDTPGMRELGLIDAEDGLGSTFGDVEGLSKRCRFNDCSHMGEPGCAIQIALDAGQLDHGRWISFQKLRKELAHLDRKEDRAARANERKRWVSIDKSQRQLRKLRDRQWP